MPPLHFISRLGGLLRHWPILCAFAVIAFASACKKENDVLKSNPIDTTDTTHHDTTHHDTTHHHDTSTVFRPQSGQYYKLADSLYGAYLGTAPYWSTPSGYFPHDVPGGDAGWLDFSRAHWTLQELPADHAICAWNDIGMPDINTMQWTADNAFSFRSYWTSYNHIARANQYLWLSSGGHLNPAIRSDSLTQIRQWRDDARFIRAHQYWVLTDLFGQAPLLTEQDSVGRPLPNPSSRQQLFNFIESELLELETRLPASGSVPNTRATKGAAQALLARLYLNAGVYTGTDRYADAARYAQKVINSSSALSPNYRWLFMADNDQAPASNEVLFAISVNSTVQTPIYGATTFLNHGSTGGQLTSAFMGNNAGWTGIRARKNLVNLFDSSAYNLGTDSTLDKRATFWVRGQSKEVSQTTNFRQGYAVYKWRNKTRNMASGFNPTYSDIDMPLFRLGEMYLIYAEAAVRGAADPTQALNYMNTLRRRAAEGSGRDPGLMTITASDLTPDFILNERGRELYWEGHRRTDLVRFGRFTTGAYLWPFKGGAQAGTGVDDRYRLYPIPNAFRQQYPNLTQNPGY